MSSAIEWTNETWNPVVGCSPVSEGCRNCYAAREAIRLAGNPNPKVSGPYAGTAEMRGSGANRRAVFTGTVRTLPERLEQPLRWRKPRRVFVNSMSDLFHEDVPLEFVDQVFAVMALAGAHTFQVLTKRPELMAAYLTEPHGGYYARQRVGLEALGLLLDQPGVLSASKRHPPLVATGGDGDEGTLRDWPLPNVWLGTSVEDQAAADERIPHLLRTPAAIRFLSCEPLIGPVDLSWWMGALDRQASGLVHDPLAASLLQRGMDEGIASAPTLGERLHWIIAGGESGPGARPCDVAWIRSLVQQCRAARVPAFVKQLGHSWYEQLALVEPRDRKGGDPEEWPVDLRVRQFPEVAHV